MNRNFDHIIKLLFVALFMCHVSDTVFGQDTLDVIVSGNPPFVMEDSLNPSGISIEVWEKLADEHGIDYNYLWRPNVDEALRQIKENEADVLVGPISITSDRAEHVRFTQPYYISSLSILSSRKTPSIWSRIKPFFSKGFFMALSILIFILTVVGTLLWLAERHKNPDQFPADPIHGIGNGIWLALVTMTTVGYGDRSPVTLPGRIIAGVWMIIALVTATSLVAGIASTLTVSGLSTTQIRNAEDLEGQKVAVVGHSPAKEFVTDHKGVITEVNDLVAALTNLKEENVDALVYDRPQLKYYLENHPADAMELAIGLGEYLPQGYGFATPMESPLSKTLSVFLLKLQEEEEIERIVTDWLGEDGIN